MQKIQPESIDLMQRKTAREHRFDAPKIHINQVNQRNLLLQHLH